MYGPRARGPREDTSGESANVKSTSSLELVVADRGARACAYKSIPVALFRAIDMRRAYSRYSTRLATAGHSVGASRDRLARFC